MKTLIAAVAVVVIFSGAAAAQPLRARATINCREVPSDYGTVLASIPKGAVVERKAAAGDWAKIAGEPDCWAAQRYLVRVAPASPSKAYRISKPRDLSAAASARATRRSTPKDPLFAPRALIPR